MRRVFVFLFLSIYLAVGCSPQANEPKTEPKTEPPNPVASGEQIFRQNCSSCHGANLEGNIGPNLQQVGNRLAKEQILGILTNGRDNMPAQSQLSEQEKQVIATWLAEKK